jgi:hypothetical protein
MIVLYAAWPLLNLALLVGVFIYMSTLFKKYRSFRTGLWLTIVIAVVYKSTMRSTGESSKGKFQTTVWLPDLAQVKTYYTQLEDLPTFSIEQVVSLTPRNQSDSVKISSSSFILGFMGGFRWSPINITVDARPGRRLYYATNGLLEWKLLGLTVYRQPRQFNGFLKR